MPSIVGELLFCPRTISSRSILTNSHSLGLSSRGGFLIAPDTNTCSLARQPHTLRDGEEHEYHLYQYPITQNRKNQGSPIQNKDHLNLYRSALHHST